jgi:hypothetical protein
MVDCDRFGRFDNWSHAMSKEQRGNKESKKPKAATAKTKVSAYKSGQGQSTPTASPFAPKNKKK